MSKGLLLIVEDDSDIATMLEIYFEAQGYDTVSVTRGEEALEICRRALPNLVILDILLPDIDGYEVCRRLRGNLRTSHIPIIFLTQKDERSDQVAGLELGADDYITKPFDLQLLMLRVEGALRRAGWLSLTSPVTGLPSSKLIEEQLRQLIRRDGWAVLYVGVNHLDEFNDVYGFVAGDDVLRFAAMLIWRLWTKWGRARNSLGILEGTTLSLSARQMLLRGSRQNSRSALARRWDLSTISRIESAAILRSAAGKVARAKQI
jgi:PleD family two-component response regulator